MRVSWFVTFVKGIAIVGLFSMQTACEEFATPAQLAEPIPIAITMTPAFVEPGQTAQLELLVATTLGIEPMLDVEWTVVEAIPGDPPLGSVSGNGRTATYTAPSSMEAATLTLPTAGGVEAATTVMDKSIRASKATIIGNALPIANPTITSVTAAGTNITPTMTINAQTDETISLEVLTDRDNPEMTYAWYSTIGEIERYQSNPTVITAPNNPFIGQIFVVIRDGGGGTTWQQIEFNIQ